MAMSARQLSGVPLPPETHTCVRGLANLKCPSPSQLLSGRTSYQRALQLPLLSPCQASAQAHPGGTAPCSSPPFLLCPGRFRLCACPVPSPAQVPLLSHSPSQWVSLLLCPAHSEEGEDVDPGVGVHRPPSLPGKGPQWSPDVQIFPTHRFLSCHGRVLSWCSFLAVPVAVSPGCRGCEVKDSPSFIPCQARTLCEHGRVH